MEQGKCRFVDPQDQFGRQAHLYAQSEVLSSGESLHVIEEWVSKGNYKRAVDIGTGTGFTAFAVAPFVDQVIAADITLPMLRETRTLADKNGVHNVGYALSAAEYLPFADGSVDLLTCRHAAHHFQDVDLAVREWRRMLIKDAMLIVADTSSPEDPVVSDWMHQIEVLRDPSHVRNLSPSEWSELLRDSGFYIVESVLTDVRLEFNDWVLRSGTPSAKVDGLRRKFLNASTEVVNAFKIRIDESGSIYFKWDCVVIRSLKVG